MPNCRNAEVFNVLRRQVWQDRVVDVVLAECRLILTKAKVSEPRPDINGSALAGLLLGYS